MKTKVCEGTPTRRGCGKTLPIAMFHKRPDGDRRNPCSDCMAAQRGPNRLRRMKERFGS